MRKILIAIVVLLVLALTVYVIIEGFGLINVNGYKEINKINGELDREIASINQIKEVEYVSKEKTLDTEIKALKETREDYLAKVEAARLKGAKGSKVQIEIYELDFIWARVGNYATDLDLEIKLDLFPGTEEKTLNDFKLYNLKFSVLGAYTDMVRFIYKLEGDNQLSAQLSDFELKPAAVAPRETTEDEEPVSTIVTLAAEFTLKNVPLNYKNIMDETKPATGGTDIDDLKLPEPNTETPGGARPPASTRPREEEQERRIDDIDSIIENN